MGFFLPVPAVAGGATEKIWFNLAKVFVKSGHEVTLISRQWPQFPDREVLDGVNFTRLRGFNHCKQLWRNLLLDFWWGLKVSRSLPNADLVVCNVVCLPIFLRWLRPAAGKVAVVLGRMPKGQTRFYRNADRLLATSEAVRDKIRADSPQVIDKTITFPNPMDWSLQQRYRAQGNPSLPITIGYVGRIHPEKGLEILLEAAAMLTSDNNIPDWRLVFIGPSDVARGGGGDDYLADLKLRWQGKFASRQLSFLGPVFNAESLAKSYGTLSIFCYPSLAEKGEGLSIAPIEAMAAGAVPIVSNLDCYRDLIRDGQNGLLFDHRSGSRATQLASQLRRLISDTEFRLNLSRVAQTDARRFDYSSSAEYLLTDFIHLIKV
ncbi:MAG TPA: glycosyltransferase family 4 protein [Opitutaceae bacterium]|nr:glycosyltransferase family 4 protein [Opitutaceae bacterium]